MAKKEDTSVTPVNELPADRKDLLKFVSLIPFNNFRCNGNTQNTFSNSTIVIFQIKNTLNQDKYNDFLKTFIEYNKNSDYEAYRTNLCSIFCEKQWIFILKGMIRFTRANHRASFQKDVDNFIQKLS